MYAVESHTIYQAFLFIWQQAWQCYLLCTYSLSALQTVQEHVLDRSVSVEILQQVFDLHEARKSVVFCWLDI